MVHTIFSIPGYVHLYRSLLRFSDIPSAKIKKCYTCSTPPTWTATPIITRRRA